jgi:hypothetical protein
MLKALRDAPSVGSQPPIQLPDVETTEGLVSVSSDPIQCASHVGE